MLLFGRRNHKSPTLAPHFILQVTRGSLTKTTEGRERRHRSEGEPTRGAWNRSSSPNLTCYDMKPKEKADLLSISRRLVSVKQCDLFSPRLATPSSS